MMAKKIRILLLKIFCVLTNAFKSRPVVLMFHSVGQGSHPQSLPAELFEAAIKKLSDSGFEFILARDLMNAPAIGKIVCLTFDDGFSDNYSVALPIMQKYNAKASFYVPTGFINKNSFLPGFKGMSESEIIALANNQNYEIGSHAISHQRLSLLSEAESADEINNSKLVLERIIDQPVKTIAYPYGDYSKRELKLVADAGYELALSTWRRRVKSAPSPYAIPRFVVDPVSAQFVTEMGKPGYELFWRLFDAVYMPLRTLFK